MAETEIAVSEMEMGWSEIVFGARWDGVRRRWRWGSGRGGVGWEGIKEVTSRGGTGSDAVVHVRSKGWKKCGGARGRVTALLALSLPPGWSHCESRCHGGEKGERRDTQ